MTRTTNVNRLTDMLIAEGVNIFNPNIRPDIAERWADYADCAKDGVDPDIFFPNPGGDAVADVAKARVICNACPVQPECLATALMKGEKSGVWGGTSWPERKTILARHKVWRMTSNGHVHWPNRTSTV